MVSEMYKFVSKLATPRLIFVLFVSFVFFYILLNFIYGVPQLKRLSGGVGVIDSTFNYSVEKVYKMIEAYGPKGRRVHISLEIFDFIFPVIYSLFFTLFVTVLFRNMFPHNLVTKTICLLPLSIIIFEYVENSGVLIMLCSYPRRFNLLAVISNAATILKTCMTVYSLVLIAIGGLYFLLKR